MRKAVPRHRFQQKQEDDEFGTGLELYSELTSGLELMPDGPTEESEAEKSIEYLKQQVANTSLADLQAMFFELIQSQTETVMLAEVRPEYVFKTIDPAVVPEEKSKPSRALICVLGTLLGGIFGVMTVLVRHYIIADSESA